jgi:hypothetical protein
MQGTRKYNYIVILCDILIFIFHLCVLLCSFPQDPLSYTSALHSLLPDSFFLTSLIIYSISKFGDEHR